MKTYVVSDIHGMYNKFMELLDKISFSKEDKLYVLGDMVDRGPQSVEVVKQIMSMENAQAIKGNHDCFALANHNPEIYRYKEVVEFLRNLPLYIEIEINNQKYIMVHGGLGAFSKDKRMEQYSEGELVWTKSNYERKYFDDIILITGHTPTQLIECNKKPGYIFQGNNQIAIDCGASFKGGRLAAFCLETGEEFYV